MRTDATLWQFGVAGLWEAKKHQEAHRLGNRILGTGEGGVGQAYSVLSAVCERTELPVPSPKPLPLPSGPCTITKRNAVF